MKKIFAISALSLAISATATGVQAEECVSNGGNGSSLQEWGIWCGVDTLLSALSTEDPSAAGPEGAEPDFGNNDLQGRNEADEFEPELESSIPLHVELPSESDAQFVGYFAESEGYGDSMMNGGISLSLTDGDDSNGYGARVAVLDAGDPDIVTYARFATDGTPIDGGTYSSEDDYFNSDEDGHEQVRTHVYLDSEGYGDYFERYESDYSNGQGSEPYSNTHEGLYGGSVYVYQVPEGQEGNVKMGPPSMSLLKDYWSGYTHRGRYDNESNESYYGEFVAGVTTVLDDVNQLVADNIVASYSGNTLRGYQSVSIEVDFGAQRFTSEFSDFENMYAKQHYGIDMDTDMSFTASGVVQGINLISDEISADAGYVQGTFFGPEAEIIGGTVDVTIDDNRMVDVFTAVEGENNQIRGGGPI